MTPEQIARRQLLAAALAYMADEVYIESSAPSAYDDASMEMHSDTLNRAIKEYVYEKWGTEL